MNPKKIAITGGPGTGKTSIVKNLEASGYFCFHEIIRTMTNKAKKEGQDSHFVSNPLVFVQDPYEFNQKLLNGRVRQFREGSERKDAFVFFDRGIPDVLAYMDYFDQEYALEFERACETHKYDQVLLVPPWKEIYISDNERLESFEEALDIHKQLQDTYSKFGYEPITVPIGTVEERTSFILGQLNPG